MENAHAIKVLVSNYLILKGSFVHELSVNTRFLPGPFWELYNAIIIVSQTVKADEKVALENESQLAFQPTIRSITCNILNNYYGLMINAFDRHHSSKLENVPEDHCHYMQYFEWAVSQINEGPRKNSWTYIASERLQNPYFHVLANFFEK